MDLGIVQNSTLKSKQSEQNCAFHGTQTAERVGEKIAAAAADDLYALFSFQIESWILWWI